MGKNANMEKYLAIEHLSYGTSSFGRFNQNISSA
jgi:hypothetical protein